MPPCYRLHVSGANQRRDPLLGATIDGRYRVVERVGAGGMAVVYSATQLNVDRPVAIKVLGSGTAQRDDLAVRFQNEARVIARLRHPNVLKLHDVGTLEDGRLYIVTELLHGAPLDRLVREGALDPIQLVRLMQPVAEALAEAHSAGVIHRDLKPANLYLERLGEVELLKVLDFGIAKLSGQAGITASGAIFGTPRYMSPEQVVARELDGRSDIYSLGVVLFECLSGRPPFDASMTNLFQRVNQPAPRLGTLVTGLPLELEALVDEMLATDRELRPATMAAVRARLRAVEEAWPPLAERARLLAPAAVLDVDILTPVELARAQDQGGTSQVPPVATRGRVPWLPLAVGAAGLVALLVVTAREPEPEPLPAMVPAAMAEDAAPAAEDAASAEDAQPPRDAATHGDVTPTITPSAAPARPRTAPARRRPPATPAPVPSGFEDVDYRELSPR